MLHSARAVSPLKGYPIRTDFGKTPLLGERLLLVGEAAGLVNPLTGDGIDFALESSRLAAQHLLSAFETGDYLRQSGEKYNQTLLQRYGEMFIYLLQSAALSPS